MNEQEWLSSNHPLAMWEHLQPLRPSIRKLIFFIDACRTHIDTNPENWANKLKTDREISRCAYDFAYANCYLNELPKPLRCHYLRDIFGNPANPVTQIWDENRGPILSGAVLTYNIRPIAQEIYETRQFSDCPILADALEDVGCQNDEILSHLRGPEQHVRGCWAIDLLTERS